MSHMPQAESCATFLPDTDRATNYFLVLISSSYVWLLTFLRAFCKIALDKRTTGA